MQQEKKQEQEKEERQEGEKQKGQQAPRRAADAKRASQPLLPRPGRGWARPRRHSQDPRAGRSGGATRNNVRAAADLKRRDGGERWTEGKGRRGRRGEERSVSEVAEEGNGKDG